MAILVICTTHSPAEALISQASARACPRRILHHLDGFRKPVVPADERTDAPEVETEDREAVIWHKPLLILAAREMNLARPIPLVFLKARCHVERKIDDAILSLQVLRVQDNRCRKAGSVPGYELVK